MVHMQTYSTKRKAKTMMAIFRLAPVLLAFFAFDAASGQQQAATPAPFDGDTLRAESSQAPVLQPRFPRYRVRAGDVLDLNFPFTPEFNQTITVQPDGYVNLRGLGDLRIQDKTVPDVADAVRSAYARMLRDPL